MNPVTRVAVAFSAALVVCIAVVLSLTSASAFADTGTAITKLSVLDALNRAESPLSNNGAWAALSWDNSTSGHNTGRDTETGWGPYDAYSTVNGAYWAPTAFSDVAAGEAASVVMQTSPGGESRYLALWLDMSAPGTEKSGYQLRWTVNTDGTFAVKLLKWSGGHETVLASNPSVTIPAGTTMAISDTAGTVSAWQGSSGALTSLLSATDSTFSSGYAGVEGSGNGGRAKEFKAGQLVDTIPRPPTLDALNRTESSLSNNGAWAALSWDNSTSGHNTGRDTETGWGPYDAYSTINGAYWTAGTFSDAGAGAGAAVTMQTSPGGENRYLALWLDMSAPGSAKSGYQLRWIVNPGGTTYTVKLSKWSSGTETVLASNSSVTIPAGTTMAISDKGGMVGAWQEGTDGALTSLLSATDSTFSSGYAGIEGSGNVSRAKNFGAGTLTPPPPPDTTISGGPTGVTVPTASFSFTASEPGASFECALDSGAYGSCTSPKSYTGIFALPEGTHTFKVRANGAGGVDLTPAERAFRVVEAPRAVTKTLLLDAFNRSEVPLATGKWSKLGWAAEIGGSWLGSYHGYGSSSGLAGAYWNPTEFNDGEGSVLVSAVVGTGSTPAGQYMSLWLDAPNPGTARSGYEARFTGVDGTATNYTVELSRWAAGTRTILASKTGFSLPVNTTFALSQTAGGGLAVWTGSSMYTPVLSAQDTTYNKGYAGIEVNGGAGTAYNFRAGQIDIEAPNTTIDSGPSGTITTESASFSFSASETGSTFECSLDGAAYVACSSPKGYSSLGSGPHTFRVRAVDAVGNVDASPAERTFTVAKAPTATTLAATEIKAEEVTLQATVNPQGAATTYQFEYGPTTSYGSKVPASPKSIGSGNQALEIAELASNLTQTSAYHYRVVAINEVGTTYGADQTFTTATLPLAKTEGVEAVNANEAVLTGQVDAEGEPHATYSFEYGPTTAYGKTGPFAEEEPGGEGESENSVDPIAGLAPETTYHYRIVAKTAAGTVAGPDKTFTTSSSSLTPQEELVLLQQEQEYTGSLPPEFMGINWNDRSKVKNSGVLSAVKNSGAQMYRVVIHPNEFSNTELNEIFQQAAYRGVRVLPYFYPGTEPNVEFWKNYIRETVERLGPGGQYWASNDPSAPDLAPSTWEIGNEPNLASNWSDGNIKPIAYGETFAALSAAAKQGAINRGQSISVLLSGLFGTGNSECTSNGCSKVSPEDFMARMGHYESYDGVSLHPYVLKVDGKKPNGETIGAAKDKVRGKIYMVHTELNALREAQEKAVNHNLPNKDIWITELGFPAGGDSDTAVSEAVQGELITATFNMVKANHDRWHIAHLFYYNIEDVSGSEAWDHHSGLRKWGGKERKPAWEAYARQAGGHPNWPSGTGHKRHHVENNRPNTAQLMDTLNNDGSNDQVHFQYWKDGSSNVITTANVSVSGVEGDQDFGQTVTGLLPETKYHFHPVATNEEEVTTVGENEEFTTPASSETSASVKSPLNGEPGWVSVGGWVHEGNGPGLTNVYVNVNFDKWENNQWVYKSTVSPHPVTNGEGYYEAQNWGVSKGLWRTRTVFEPQNGYKESSSDYHEFTIKNGYQLAAVHSGKCLDVSGESYASGALMQQWECLSAATQQNQVFTIRPKGGGHFELVARHSDKCVDVQNGSMEVGAPIQQWDCNGTAAQSWSILPAYPEPNMSEYVNVVSERSGQCLDVSEGSMANGARIHQWPCLGTNQANQIWHLKSVESNDIKTSTYLTVGRVFNGQPGYVNVSGTVVLGNYPVAGQYVNVNFEKMNSSGNYEYVDTIEPHPTLNGESRYEYQYWGVGAGDWRVRTVYPGSGALASSSSEYHYFHVGTGYRLRNRYSGKCLSVSEDRGDNGAPIIQWDCSPAPSPGDGQVLTLVPLGGGYYNLRVNRSVSISKCIDVTGVSQEPHAKLQLWDCLGAGQANQLWEEIPISGQSPWVAFRVKHSGQCLDNTGPSLENGNWLQQYPCNWSGAQQWEIQAIG